MQSSLEKLQKFFRLEAEKGYTDQAIIGGLGRILDFWEGEARNDNIPEEIIQAVVARLRDYHRLSPDSRSEALKGLWKRIQEQVAPAEESTVPEVSTDTGKQDQPVQTETRQPEPAQPTKPKPGPATSHPGAQTSVSPAALSAPLTVLSGIGPRTAQSLSKLGLRTLGDMLYYFPRRHDDYSQLKPINRLWYGDEVTVIGSIQSVSSRPIRGGKAQILEVVIGDGSGSLRLTWFNQPWLTNRLKQGETISVSGKIDQYLGRLIMNNPDWEPVEVDSLHTNRIVPIYPLTATITQKWLRKQMNQVVSFWSSRVVDPLPESIRSSAGLVELSTAIQQIHFPDNQEDLVSARKRLAFDEIFYLQMGVLRQKRDWQSATARAFDIDEDWLESRKKDLPFELTRAQSRAVMEIRSDLGSGRPMNRLLQGDVGSGKTIVSALAVAMINKSGAQAAVMAPTSILAEQHYRNFIGALAKTDEHSEGYLEPNQIRMLVGDTGAAERKEIHAGLTSGEIKVLIGTHALIEDPVQFADLQLVVIDEQHRFGVEQRAALRSKGDSPHLLIMTATPIPRSLALTIYGDLDLLVMDEMPPGRQEIATYVLTPQERERAYSLIHSQIQDGRQAFIVYPLIEESDKSESRAAVEEHERLQKEIFQDLKLGLLHGRLRPDEKDNIMARFRDAEFDILVTTTVIEVGVDVPNATVMLIEGANRFGLAQLHQLRGRVGRGAEQSYCLLIPDHEDAVENERLQAMAETNDGFVLAELDLKQRGPGEFLGTRQSGYTGLRLASLSDAELIENAREQALSLFDQDPNFQDSEHELLGESLERFWGGGKGDAS